ncbi:phage tail length tape measure family protein [Pseudoruegeria sp. HB172150]|uniref:phage tail length tape measure family protein n=1 Tax=Pseudoruegeria sp. HB172150 TaxID=2721164 RepID=UPI0015562AB5|nr:phage tail length tape measure family protein [Pseudoruegeria sp. HB172150]
MTFSVSMLLQAVGGQAARADVDKTSATVRGLGRAGDEATRSQGRFSNALARTRTGLTGMATSARAWAAGMREGTTQTTLAAGGVANLTAQFNDVGVMLAAGQNPLQLALQQGSQITQVLGPLGAGGAVRALGSAFLSLLSPINLITIGSIAAGAAMFQWLTSAGEEAKTLEDILDDLDDAIDNVRSRATLSAAEIREEFGSISPEIARLLRDLRDIGFDELVGRANAASERLVSTLDLRQLAAFTGETGTRRWSRTGRAPVAEGLLGDLQSVGDAEDLDGQIQALEAFQTNLLAAAEATGGLTTEQRELYDQTVLVEDRLRRAQGAAGATGAALLELGKDIAKSVSDVVSARVEELVAADDMLTNMREQNEIAQAILKYGADSAEVAELRADAVLRAKLEEIEALPIARQHKEEMREAAEETHRLAVEDIASGIGAAADRARLLAENLGISLATAQRIAALGPQGTEGETLTPGRGGDPRSFGGTFYDWNNQEGTAFLDAWKEDKSGARQAAAEREAVEDLIESLTTELDILREIDPVQKEMLRNRETLKAATTAERDQIEDLIRTRIDEEDALSAATEKAELFSRTLYDGLHGLTFEGETLIDVLDQVALSIADAAFEAALLGSGSLAGAFGTEDSGGLLGMIFGVPGQAAGGPVFGPGTGTSDEVPRMLSNGEFVVNAHAAARHRDLLELINSGQEIRGLASGGFAVPPPPSSAGAGASGGVLFRPQFYIDNQGSTPIQGDVQDLGERDGQRAFRLVFADQVGRALAERGAGGRQTLQNTFGVRQRGTRR